ncbi:hypothetical protein NDU88_003400 [Pleurodeles waltl]|uniref:Uncharacterized protein n=1 Tax=Pleurodeles waltl TaxID=8319 RepID=A0AAV7KUR7_PLEWA|nr:hypothetical protein NDU88_003400 [Pleurodeles waltl]
MPSAPHRFPAYRRDGGFLLPPRDQCQIGRGGEWAVRAAQRTAAPPQTQCQRLPTTPLHHARRDRDAAGRRRSLELPESTVAQQHPPCPGVPRHPSRKGRGDPIPFLLLPTKDKPPPRPGKDHSPNRARMPA